MSGVDDAFVERVYKLLPDAIAHFYRRSFANGEDLVRAMEERVGQASVFVLFASRAALESVWVHYEIDRARIARIRRPDFRVIVIPIGHDVSHRDLPAWMQELWVDGAGKSARDIARYISNALHDLASASSPHQSPVGRGGFTDELIKGLNEAFLTTRSVPNTIILAGNTGIGRRTVKRKFAREGFPGRKELDFGPELLLPQFADSLDLYRALRQEIDDQFTLASFEAEADTFSGLTNAEKAAELARAIAYYGDMGQAVTLVTGNGLFEDRGILKPWTSELFSALRGEGSGHLFVIAGRLAHVNELRPHTNVMQWQVPALSDDDVKTVIITTERAMAVEPQLPGDHVLRAIGGHPGIARTTAHLIIQRGAQALNDNLRDLYVAQDEVLRESLSYDVLSAIERDILSILSWVPQIGASTVRDIVCRLHQVEADRFAEIAGSLALSCLLIVSGPNYAISGPIRSVFRRLHGFGSSELQAGFASELRAQWEREQAAGEFSTELFDAFIYMIALEGSSLPAELAALVSPATIQGVIRDTYDNGHNDDAALRRVVAWGLPAKEMSPRRIDEAAREEILSYVVRAQTRLQDREGARAMLAFFDGHGYRSAFYLRAFYIRHLGGDLREAVRLLKLARDVRKYKRQVIQDLALCYLKLGWWRELDELIAEESTLDDDPVILDIKIGQRLAANDWLGAEDGIAKLRSHPRDSGRSASRAAMLVMKRDHNYSRARTMLTDVIQRGAGAGHLAVRRLRAIAAAEEGRIDLAEQDLEYLRPRVNGVDTALRIESRILNKQGNHRGAEEKLDQLTSSTGPDHLLRARILEDRSRDLRESLPHRNDFKAKALSIRALYARHSEYDESQNP